MKVLGISGSLRSDSHNTALLRNDNVLSTSFNALAQNLSPRILRVGVVFGF